jgi:hypothetical protein
VAVNRALGHSLENAWSCADWLVRVRVATWMELAGQGRRARAVRRLAPLRDSHSAESAVPVLVAARRACAQAAEREAAWEAEWAYRLVTAKKAAVAAAVAVASTPIWLEIREAANLAPWGAARDAIGDTVWDCTWSVAWDAAWDAEDAHAREAAAAALEATAVALEVGAIELLESGGNTLRLAPDHPRGEGTHAQGA